MNNNKKLLLIGLLVLLFAYLLILQVIAIWPFTIDDMYISLRYARHWAAGHGLVWNIGEEPVEGYSNFSFVVLAAVAIRLGFNPIIVLKAAGWLSLVFSAFGVYCLSRFWFSTWLALIPSIWLLLYKAEIIWSVSGLETTAYQALIAFSLVFLLRGMGYCFYPETRNNPNSYFFALAGLMLALAGLTRPETPVFMLLFSGLALIDRPMPDLRKNYYQGLLLGCSVSLVIYVPYFLWRWCHYGRLLPNPVYCKGFISYFAELDKDYVIVALPFIILALPAILQARDKRHYFFWLPSLLYLILLIHSDPVSAFENRLFLPVFSLLLPLSFLGLSEIWANIFHEKKEVFQLSLVISAIWVAIFLIPSLNLVNYRSFTHNPQTGIRLRMRVVEWLSRHVPADSQVVLADSGLIPYFSPLRYIDSYCLNNKSMTVPPIKDMYERLCHEIFITKPEVIILTSMVESGKSIYAPTDVCLHQKLQHSNIYQFRTAFTTKPTPNLYRYEIYTLAH